MMSVDWKEQLTKLFNHPLRVPVSVGVVSFGIGTGVGYILGRRNKIEVHQLPNQIDFDFKTDELAADIENM